MQGKARRFFILVGLALSVAFILWLTLFSRLDSDSRHFYPPFYSYRAVISGNGKALLEVIGNILLFLPVGVIAGLILHLDLRQTIVFGLAFSLIIESCQWFFWLGTFETDDLLHNTIGAVIGNALVKKLPPIKNRQKNALILASLIVLFTLVGFGYQELKQRTMIRYAAMNDSQDGKKNLLVLSPYPKHIGKTNYIVSYNSDGSVLISGKADKRAWIEIGKVTLPSGTYVFSGLSDVPEKTIAIELEYYDQTQNNFIRLTRDVGPVEEEMFELADTTRLRALIGLYAGAEGEYLARPVIYEEDQE